MSPLEDYFDGQDAVPPDEGEDPSIPFLGEESGREFWTDGTRAFVHRPKRIVGGFEDQAVSFAFDGERWMSYEEDGAMPATGGSEHDAEAVATIGREIPGYEDDFPDDDDDIWVN